MIIASLSYSKRTKKALIAEIRFTPNHNIQLIALGMSTSEILLKSSQQLERTIHLFLPYTTGLQQEGQEA